MCCICERLFTLVRNYDRCSTKETPWLFRTYAGHSTAAASNVLFRANLAKGKPANFPWPPDPPTQTGYDSDHELQGEVGKVGVPVNHLGDMRALFKDIPLEQMNTSINHQRHRTVALGALYRGRRGTGRDRGCPARHGAE